MGPGKTHPETGVPVDIPCALGDKVLYGEFDGTAVDYMGTDHQFVRDQDILFVYSGERMEPSTIKMIRDELLVKVDPEATTTKSGLLLGQKEENTGEGSTTGEVPWSEAPVAYCPRARACGVISWIRLAWVVSRWSLRWMARVW
ncbi:conserved unknown protein [Ectocarpus siliculosus]|uniref:Uncharacterized protein n=1 Tax=Ectocarpus siliculosus TaxID=2880 RepID=D7FNY7_ECTSI|nr:conserved unknown protein [Ectocarpus siliculosus]|eukprot:CBJ30256.1 conserved unknown protein [Ectocarpus siliculosus]